MFKFLVLALKHGEVCDLRQMISSLSTSVLFPRCKKGMSFLFCVACRDDGSA